MAQKERTKIEVAYDQLGTGKGYREHRDVEIAVSAASILADASVGVLRISGHYMDADVVEIYFEGKYNATLIFSAR